jgi:hypothetical protein
LQGIVPNDTDHRGCGPILPGVLEPTENDEPFQFSDKSLAFGT